MKQTPSIQRLQGTDGIRGRVQSHEVCSIKSPISAFTELGILTDNFFELYTFSYCQELLQAGFAKSGDPVVIGWDPRDRQGIFNQAAMRGIQKAGLTVFNVGVLPTPAIALYLLHTNAPCAFVLTASHNPSDQNGIKIFLGRLGLKLFPVDDQHFTQQLLQADFHSLTQASLLGQVHDHFHAATELFIQFSLDSFNSWLNPSSFENFILIIDAANGAYSNVIQLVFNQLPIDRIIYTNVDFNQEINKNSGVADLEGIIRIPSDMIDTPSGKFANYETLQQLLKEGRRLSVKAQRGDIFCSALVFDGDGDRFFRLDYDPFRDDVIVISGDKLAFFQGQFLKQKGFWDQNTPLFVNTVESDMESSRAAQKLGFETCQSAVGDKWILWQSFISDWKARSKLYRQSLTLPRFHQALDTFDALLIHVEQLSSFEALEITRSFQEIEKQFLQEGGTVDALLKIKKNMNQLGASRFVIGSEESGHIITLGILETKSESRSVYIGNGLKSALNTFASVKFLSPKNVTDYYQWLHEPYVYGFQKSLPIYYIAPNLLNPDTEFRKDLIKFLFKEIESVWPGKVIQEIPRPEDPLMLYLVVEENNQMLASIFLRNSGTEDKMSLYFRGRMIDQTILNKLSDRIFQYLLPRVKDLTKLFAQAEFYILNQLNQSSRPKNKIQIDAELVTSLDRLLREMSVKQKLIEFEDQKWRLTVRGKSLVNFSERSEKS